MIIYLFNPKSRGGAESIAFKIMHSYLGQSAVLSFHDDKRIIYAFLIKYIFRVKWIHINQANPYAVVRTHKGRLYYFLLRFSDELYSVGEEAGFVLKNYLDNKNIRNNLKVIDV
jgi:hypothetical protein